MRALGYNCKAKVSSATNRETAYISGLFGFALPELKASVVPQTRLILTDHTDYAQCVDGAREARILQKIDHHVEGDILDSNIPYVRREMIGSTCNRLRDVQGDGCRHRRRDRPHPAGRTAVGYAQPQQVYHPA